jgi:inorganic triphosphatase YgiF
MKDTVEIELKFLAEAETLEALASHPELQGRETIALNRSVYFDTPDGRLRGCGLGLRVRDTGRGFVQTVKREQGGAVVRGEWETRIQGQELDTGALAATPVAEVLDGEIKTLAPVFTTTVERRARARRKGGSVIEVAFDRGEVSTGERQAAVQELELELKKGDPAVLFELARKLAADVDIRISFESKAEQGYRLAEETSLEPRHGANPPLEPGLPAGRAFQRIAQACLQHACSNAALLRTLPRPEAVHQMRVGLRRLRAAFKAFEPLSTDHERPRIDAELKWLAQALDAARDLDVFIHEAFTPAAAESDDPQFAELGRQLLQAQTRAYDHALEAVQSRRCWLALLDAAAWIETGPWSRSQDPVIAELRERPIELLARDALDHLRQVIRRRARPGLRRLDPVSRHKLRIRAKRLRYAVEFFEPLFPGRRATHRAFLARLKSLQDQLGALNDLAMSRERLLPALAAAPPDVAFAAGRIVGRRECGEAKLLRRADRDFQAFGDCRPFWRPKG